MGTTLGDFARGGRLFATQPGYAWAAVLTLALAIGANTVIFSVANVLVVKPLPMRDAGRLGWIRFRAGQRARSRRCVAARDAWPFATRQTS